MITLYTFRSKMSLFSISALLKENNQVYICGTMKYGENHDVRSSRQSHPCPEVKYSFAH